ISDKPNNWPGSRSNWTATCDRSLLDQKERAGTTGDYLGNIAVCGSRFFCRLRKAGAVRSNELSRLRSNKPDAARRASILRLPTRPDRFLRMEAVDAYDVLHERRGKLPANPRSPQC